MVSVQNIELSKMDLTISDGGDIVEVKTFNKRGGTIDTHTFWKRPSLKARVRRASKERLKKEANIDDRT